MGVSKQEADANYEHLLTKARSEPEFKSKLLADPHAALEEAGAEIEPGVTINVVENTDDTLHVVLPAHPSGDDSVDLDAVTGGTMGIGFAVGSIVKFHQHSINPT